MNWQGQAAAKILTALLLLLVPVLHPLLIPVAGVASHLLWLIHVLPVSLMSYFFGIRGAIITSAASFFLLVFGERLFGGGSYGLAADWDMVWSLAIALQITNGLMALFTLYAGKSARKLNHMLFTHTLTDLPNRRFIEDYVKDASGKGQLNGTLLFIDVDDFDSVNYIFGHACGDAVLLEMAKRMKANLPTKALLGHWAGDKFAIYLQESSRTAVESLINRIKASVETPIEIKGFELKSLSAGIGIAPVSTKNLDRQRQDSFFQDADTALNRAKQSGRAGVCFFEDGMKEAITARLTLLNDLFAAINDDTLMNYYQPIHASGSDRIIGVEALIRWQHPARGFISPADFIPVAEQTGLIVKLGEQVMHRAFSDFSEWRTKSLCEENFLISINIAPAQLAEKDFSAQVKLLCRQYGITPASVILEITESEMMQSQQVSIQVLRQLSGMGFNIAIDDFGSGYSSLNYLHKLPVSILKIDREIIQQIGDGRTPLMRPIAEIAKSFGLKMIAEGIENSMQKSYLKALSVDYLQGFLLSRPLPKSALEELLLPSRNILHTA